MADDAHLHVALGELLGEHRELPGDDDAMFTVERRGLVSADDDLLSGLPCGDRLRA